MKEIKIGHVLKRLLWQQRKTLKGISRETGIPYSTLHTWQENRQPKDILKAQLLADYFKISLHELLFDCLDARTDKASDENPKQTNEDFFKGRFEVIVRRLE